jgi:hypothetical protein
MTARAALGWYGLANGILAGMAGGVDSWRGVTGAAAAGILCLVPLVVFIVRRRVAGSALTAKLRANRGLNLLPDGLVFRLGFVLGAAFIAYAVARERLGVGFWISVLVLYQVALGLTVALALPQPRPMPLAGQSAAVGD